MRLFVQHLSLLALAILLISPSIMAFDFDRRDRTSVEGNFSTSTATDSSMTTSDSGSSTASSRMVFTSATSVQSASSTPHGPTATASASTTGGSSSGQNRAITLSDSQFAVGIGAIAGLVAFNML